MPIDGRAVGAISITNRSVKFFAKTPGNPLGKNTCYAPYTADYQYISPYNDLRLPLGIGSASGLEFSISHFPLCVPPIASMHCLFLFS